jgi:hypothetical protein
MNSFSVDLDKKNYPEWDVVKATPIRIPFDKNENGKALIFNIPSTEKYFDFEAEYTSILATHFIRFSQTKFLSYDEFSNKTLKEKFFEKLKEALSVKEIKQDFVKIIKKYFDAENFEMKNLLKESHPLQIAYSITLIHNCIEFVKKKFQDLAGEISPQILDTFSTSLKGTSKKVERKYS